MNKEIMIEEFLNKNSFYCKTYKARITKLQCEYNCGRTIYNINMYYKKLKQIETDPGRWGNLENLFYTQLFLGKMTCKDCPKFTEINPKTQEWLDELQRKGEFFVRMPPNTVTGFHDDAISASSSLGG